MLTDDQLKHYADDGYIHLKGVVPEDALALARTVLERWVDELVQSGVEPGRIDDAMAHLDFQQRLAQAWIAADKPGYVRSPRRDLVSPEMFEFLKHPSFVAIAESILDSKEIYAHGVYNARPKLPDQPFTDTPWHQDAQYYQDAEFVPVISMWMPLQKVTTENSCLQVVPGFHKGKLQEAWQDERTNFIGLSPEIQKTLNGVPIEMEPGDLLCFTPLTPHGAMPNKSDTVRWSMDIRFEDTDHGTVDSRKRGFIAKSVSDPSRETSYEDWLELWKDQGPGTY